MKNIKNSLILLIVVTLINILFFNVIVQATTTYDAEKALDKVQEEKSFKSYNEALVTLEVIKDQYPSEYEELSKKLSAYWSVVVSPEIKNFLSEFEILSGNKHIKGRKDLGTYNYMYSNLIPKVTNEIDRLYLLEELSNLSLKIVFTEDVKSQIKALNKAWQTKTYEDMLNAEKLIYNNPTNWWTSYYLQGELNSLKHNISNKKKVLIIGDSLEVGSALNNGQLTHTVENTWWSQLQKENSQYIFEVLAIPGIGIEHPDDNCADSKSTKYMFNWLQTHGCINKQYHTIIFALSANDAANGIPAKTFKNSTNLFLKSLSKNGFSCDNLLLMNYFGYDYQQKDLDPLDELNNSFYKDKPLGDIKYKYLKIPVNKIERCSDGVHPTFVGQSVIKDEVKEILNTN